MSSDPLTLILYVSFVLLLVCLNGFFVAAEFAMVRASRSRIEKLAEEGSRRARFSKSIIGNLDAYLSACQLGVTMTSLGLGWVGGLFVARLLEPALQPLLPDSVIQMTALVAAFSLITVLHIILGEQFPKRFALRKSDQVTLHASVLMVGFYKLMYPFIWFVDGVSNMLLRLTGMEPYAEHRSAHSEEEIRVMMKESNRSGFIDNTELTLVDNIFDFAETNAREIMIPRTEMICLYANRSYEENKMMAISEMHTRYPVCDPDKDNIIGFVHIKDLLKIPEAAENIQTMVRPITKVPESMQISVLLKLMQKKKTQMALLIDEYGGTSGIVTFEDIIEEIVGEIQDEFDEERPKIERRDAAAYSIDGRMLIEEVNSYFGIRIETDDYDTIGGWIYSRVEMPPQKHQHLIWNDEYDFMIEEIDHLRISRILIIRKGSGVGPDPVIHEG
ncbi:MULTISPECIES: hemolysin family protein [unclassified Paenibacillus]|uniref:hemolysin family protein n=1 Tax=unclassified Paenibacillus TaxID=185978 RepID=UPI001B6D53E7|nr:MULTISPECIES: hemolysin family protein [unclassified Paenibacillus]MBP1156530.1 CBS domain containing-hemolysin-like protein [Paenibacillus sp. PvP091]MBP1172732.1 CBS domain containing-hemolysin-like protein [Paenibacillus sp. PvR098]MBP2439112.1 CBS domain containing-hemolysin-like protein [Paenibacillus sp. PvP052]